MDALELSPGDGQVAGSRGAAGQEDRIEFALKFIDRYVRTDVGVGVEHDAFFAHQVEPPVENILLHFEFGNAVSQESADTIGALENGDPVPRLIQLSGRCKSRGARSNNGNRFARPHFRTAGPDDSFFESAIDDGDFDVFDRHRIGIDPENARPFARRRADPAGKLREVIRCEKSIERFLPLAFVDEVVPVGNDVSERAALMAERNAAIHASRSLRLKLVFRELLVDLLVVVDSLRDRTAFKIYSADFQKARRITHVAPSRTSWLPAPSAPGRADNRAA